MCGRYSISKKAQEIGEYFNITIPEEFQGEIYNAAPTQHLPVITMDQPDSLRLFHWGLQTGWENPAGGSSIMINARSESIHEKKLFRNLLDSQRCIIPADGFFEWERKGKFRQPWRFLLRNEGLFAFAGLFNLVKDTEDQSHYAFSIITTRANALLEGIHDRMPVILDKDSQKAWLNETNISTLKEFLEPFPVEKMIHFKVSPKANHTANNLPELIKPWKDPNLTLF